VTASLAEFTEARLAGREARARSLLTAARIAREIVADPQMLGRLMPGWDSWPDVEAMCEQALREVTAMRAILAAHHVEHVGHIDLGRPVWDEHECHSCGNLSGRPACGTVLALAAIWNGHPDYRAGWAPEAVSA
jgi:hypothetical protein